MQNVAASRFQFIAHALRADGPFRPAVRHTADGLAELSGHSYLVRYPRESAQKYARRNELAFFASPLAQACARFLGYLSTKPVVRELPHPLYAAMADDIDGKGDSVDVFFQRFMADAKARGSMLLLVDMPPALAPTLLAQVEQRVAPYWSAIAPETVSAFELADDGRFDFVEFRGTFSRPEGGRIDVLWHFDRAAWWAEDADGIRLTAGEHPLGECPVLIWTEGGDFPHFGPFAAIADLSRRLFNLDSELDEILRSQTFSLLTMQVPDQSTDAQKLEAARVAGETIGTNNLMVHSGSTPAFIAPPDGPARIYLDRIEAVRAHINEIGLNAVTINERESGIAMQMRFQALNSELAAFAARVEDLERRAWELSRRWLGMTTAPEISWPRDFNIADVAAELQILSDMQAASMPEEIIAEQMRRVVHVQFSGMEQETQSRIHRAIDERVQAVQPSVMPE